LGLIDERQGATMDVISLGMTRIRLEDVEEENVWLDDEWPDSVGSTISP
jgi:hypothetical protein